MIGNFSSIKTNPSTHSSQVRHHLHLVFIYYSSFADRNNYHLLKHQNYRRFLIDSEIVKSTNDFPEFDIIFKKISKGNSNSINFQEFLKLLPQLGMSVYQGETKQAAFKRLIKKDIKKLQLQIRQNSQFGQDLSIVESFLENALRSTQQIQLANKLMQSSIIRKCYEVYISSTSMHQKSPSDTFESFYKFLKDFEISPQLIYKSICYVTFMCLLIKKPQGTRNQFELESFVKMIMLLGEIIIRKEYSAQEATNIKMRMCRILEKMEVSAGFQKISKLVKGQTYLAMSLVRIVMDEDGMLPGQQLSIEDIDHSLERGSPAIMRHKGCSISMNVEKLVSSSYDSLNTLANQPQQFKQIKRIFEDLCAYGQVGNNKTLKSIKIKKLYTQVGLLKAVTQIWLDLTITDLVRRSSSGKIQFIQFVQLLNQTAKKLNVCQNDIYNLVINSSRDSSGNFPYNSISNSQIGYTEQQMVLLMEMLQTISYSLQRVFHYYSKSKNQISFPEMTKLMYEFEVFPSILTKTRMYQIFCDCYEQSLDKIAKNQTFRSPDLFLKDKFSSNKKVNSASKYNSSNMYNSVQKSNDPHLKQQKLMHISSFPLFLLKASNEICEQGLTAAQKLIILIQKMHESKGQTKVVLGKGSLVSELRKNYPNIYKMSFGMKESKVESQVDVQDLLDTISQY